MARIPVNAPGVSTAGAGAATLWKAMATAVIVPPATTPDYRFGELLSEVSGSWSNSSQGTALAIAPPLVDRLPLSSYESAGEIKLETTADIAAARIFCSTLLQFRPTLYVVYR